jgi:hypothetical protein
VIVTDPETRAVARPELVIEATVESEELHCTELVMLVVVPSER